MKIVVIITSYAYVRLHLYTLYSPWCFPVQYDLIRSCNSLKLRRTLVAFDQCWQYNAVTMMHMHSSTDCNK